MLKRICFCLALLVLPNCARQGTTSFLAAPNLVTSAEQVRDLLALNSVLLAVPQIAEGARLAAGNQESFYHDLCAAAERQLDLRTVCEVPQRTKFDLQPQQVSTARALELARQQRQDGVLYTIINQYVPRVGSQIGAEATATVSFSLQLFRSSDGKKMWEANYFFRDTAVSQDLVRAQGELSRGEAPMWRDAREVLQEGFGAALADLSAKRATQFS